MSMFATFCESVFGIFELVVWFGFGLIFFFLGMCSFGGDFLSFLLYFSLSFSLLFFPFFLSFVETEEQSS